MRIDGYGDASPTDGIGADNGWNPAEGGKRSQAELRDVLNRVADRIADSGRHQSETFRDMHSRVSRLADRATDMRDEAATKCSGALERAYDQVSALAS